MPISLTPADENALTIAITKAAQIATASRFSGVRIPREEWLDALLPQLSQSLTTAFAKQLDENGISGFVRAEFLKKYFEDGNELPTRSAKKLLSSSNSFADPLSAAQTIINRIKSLPDQYRLIIRGPSVFSYRFKGQSFEIKLSNRLSLVSHDKLPENRPSSHPSKPTDLWLKTRVDSDSIAQVFREGETYLVYRSSGYIGGRYSSRIVREASDEIRAFYGCCIAFGIFLEDYMGFGFDAEDVSSALFIAHRKIGDEIELAHIEAAETDLQRAAALDTTLDFDKRVKAGLTIEEALRPVQAMFASDESGRLSTASIWLLRTWLSAKEMDKVLEATIAIEVLLGDRQASDRVGLSKLMANRCAYALGRTSEERKHLDNLFVEFYRVRSEVVHSGKVKASESERHIVEQGVELAARILKHEISLYM